jgi:hypothetical protein
VPVENDLATVGIKVGTYKCFGDTLRDHHERRDQKKRLSIGTEAQRCCVE